ncbi:hypothetical protein D3C78_1761320 [compost metagenome]
MPIEWISQASEVGQRRSSARIGRLSQAWKAWPISWVSVVTSPSVPVLLQKITTLPVSS